MEGNGFRCCESPADQVDPNVDHGQGLTALLPGLLAKLGGGGRPG